MIRCAKCTYGWNPDTATNCVQCKAPLTASATPPRSDTLSEDTAKPENLRNATIAEGVPFVSSPGNLNTPPSVPERWSVPNQAIPNQASSSPVSANSAGSASVSSVPVDANAGGANLGDSGLRRRTVFAGSGSSGEAPVANFGAGSGSSSGSGSPPRTPLASGSRRPQTVAVDPGRKIVGVLITYSWQESGQVFPVLEGRNLIGKDPDQCDICIPQDATLSAVNSFITYRRHFLIGDKVSMSGTDVDGEPIEQEFVPLRNYAKIRTGSTYWTFVCIQPPSPEMSGDTGSGA